MEDRKLRRIKKEEKVKEKKERKPINKLNLITRVLVILMTVALIAVIGIVIYLKVLPNKYLIPLCIIALGIAGAGVFFSFRKKTSNKLKVILSAVSVVLIAVLTFVGLKLGKTLSFLGEMETETVNSKTYSVVVLKDSKFEKMEDLAYKMLLYYDTELNQNAEAIKKLEDVITIVTEKTDDVHELAEKLVDNKVDAILIEDSYYAIIEEEIPDFKERTRVVYTFALEETLETIAKNVSVTKEPFVIYVSGIDSYGKISSVARSDVNMLVVVNPQTKQVLLVNTPRDYYVKLHGTSGYRDKLTHAGIYGIDMSVKTMEDLYDVDINYYVRVNFTSLIKIIDAIGGINVYSEYAFTSRIGGYKFRVGYNQMNGKKALGFARERYSFSDGDRMRGQNQQAVIDAMIKKVCSSTTILTRFDALLDSLKGSFQTNMNYTKMIELVRMQIADGAEWNVSSTSVDGSGSMERTYSMGRTLLSVLIPYAGSINQAESMIKAVLNGETLEAGAIDISKYNDYLVVSRGVYETEKPKEEKPEVKPEENTDTELPPEEGDATTGEGTDDTGTGDGTGTNEGTGDSGSGDTGSGDTTTGGDDNTGGTTGGDTGSGDSGNTDTGDTDNGSTGGDIGSGDASGDTDSSEQPTESTPTTEETTNE